MLKWLLTPRTICIEHPSVIASGLGDKMANAFIIVGDFRFLLRWGFGFIDASSFLPIYMPSWKLFDTINGCIVCQCHDNAFAIFVFLNHSFTTAHERWYIRIRT